MASKPKMKCHGKCQKEKSVDLFYKSQSPKHEVFGGYCPYCKDCLKKLVYQKGIFDVEKLKFVLKHYLDKPFFSDVLETAMTMNTNNHLGTYLKQLNLKKQAGRDIMTWKDGETEEELKKDNECNKNLNDKDNYIEKNTVSPEELQNLIDKYGYGYPHEEYVLFEKKYQELRPSFQLLTTMHEECLREYCINKTKEGLAKAKGDFKEAKEWAGMAKDVANSGKLNPSQMSKSDLSGGLDTFGQLSKMVGQTDKGEILKILPRFTEKPKDRVDVTLWHYINYIRDIKGLPECEYNEIYEFYNRKAKEYESKTLDLELMKPSKEEVDSNG